MPRNSLISRVRRAAASVAFYLPFGGSSEADDDNKGGDDKGAAPKPEDKGGDDKGGAPKPDDKKGDAGKGDDGKSASELQAKFEGQQKVNRDLEAKLNQLRDGIKAAVGVEDKKATTDDLVTKLQEQLQSLTHSNLVADVARRHNITEDEDIALLADIKDADAMKKLAARLAPKAGDKNDDTGKPRRPRPDASQGGGSSTDGGRQKSSSVSAAREEHLAARQKSKSTT